MQFFENYLTELILNNNIIKYKIMIFYKKIALIIIIKIDLG